MASEPFYELKMKRKDISYLEIKKSLNAIREAIDYAAIDSRIVKILENQDNRSVIYKHICNFYNLRYESK